MKQLRMSRSASLLIAALFCVAGFARAQRAPRIGYLFPAGGQIGHSFEIQVGGQGLDAPLGAVISGGGVQVQILEHIKPLGAVAAADLREKVRDMQAKLRERRAKGEVPETQILSTIRQLMREAEVTQRDLLQLADYDRRRNDPKVQQNVQIGETVRVRVTIAETADPGTRWWRLSTEDGLSNPMRFVVGTLPEINETAPEDIFDFEHYTSGATKNKRPRRQAIITPAGTLPVTLNGQILPGEEDVFSFQAKKDDRLVIAVQARHLTPYLADAVPGWFQAVVSLADASGNEIAYADDYHFDPDPVLFYKIPADGEYRIKVRDSIYRGREDFVYRISAGQLPFATGITPLGTKAGSTTDITFMGGNLGDQFKQRYTAPHEAGIVSLQASAGGVASNAIPFQIDTCAEEMEREPNNRMGVLQELQAPVVINGRIDSREDVDFFRVKGRGNRDMVFEVFARRLGSPLDASITAYDTGGKEIGHNDDHEDPAAGLTTHHADSRLVVKLPATGECFIRVSDTQKQGSINHAYRLHVTEARPHFLLRITPSTLNVAPGGNAKLTVHALRIDGFEGEIALQFTGSHAGFELKNAIVPAGKDVADITLSAPTAATDEPASLSLQGIGKSGETILTTDAVPAEDMMQAFIYRHLVPSDALLVDVRVPPVKKKK